MRDIVFMDGLGQFYHVRSPSTEMSEGVDPSRRYMARGTLQFVHQQAANRCMLIPHFTLYQLCKIATSINQWCLYQ